LSTTQERHRYSGGDATAIAAPRPSWLEARPALPSRRRPLSFDPRRQDSHLARDRACRVLNVVVASIAVLVTAPLMMVVWALVRLTSPGPAIFKQPRVGIDRRQRSVSGIENGRREADQGGKIFTIFKFRTMRTDQPAAEVWAAKDDPRITAVGKFLRSSRLDELPQLFNVLKGDMNIVGPRPEQPKIFASLSEEVGEYRERQKVLPGITGLAQVHLGYDQSVEDVKRKVDLDLEYIRRRSAVEDLMIMARTPAVMVFRKGWM
jgi:lipopolysaccharide/colanic/teichoic acid biosynthesis glycosyltransferase